MEASEALRTIVEENGREILLDASPRKTRRTMR